MHDSITAMVACGFYHPFCSPTNIFHEMASILFSDFVCSMSISILKCYFEHEEGFYA